MSSTTWTPAGKLKKNKLNKKKKKNEILTLEAKCKTKGAFEERALK